MRSAYALATEVNERLERALVGAVTARGKNRLDLSTQALHLKPVEYGVAMRIDTRCQGQTGGAFATQWHIRGHRKPGKLMPALSPQNDSHHSRHWTLTSPGTS